MSSGADADVSADAAAIAGIRTALTDAAVRLTGAGARTEALAEYEPARRVLLVPRPERLRSLGRVWRIGVLLLGVPVGPAERTGAVPPLFATGSLTRPSEPGRRTFIAESAERRRQLRVAAHRGHFRPGESVNFDATPIPVDASLAGASGPLTVRDGAAFVRWSPSDPTALTAFDIYLADRVSLLVEPPAGA